MRWRSESHSPIRELDAEAAQFAGLLAAADAMLDRKLAAGRELWITTGAIDVLTNPVWRGPRPAGPHLERHLRERFRWQAQRAAGFDGWRLLPRGG
ncbi:MAG: hypothetical protein IPK26_02720 [Planctomycetes bacterium]|nr:hypothetical protein [Planctomycetota bacterium]